MKHEGAPFDVVDRSECSEVVMQAWSEANAPDDLGGKVGGILEAGLWTFSSVPGR